MTLNKSNNYRGYNIKYLPYVLTEQGIMMLSGLLKSDIAVKVNVQIIDAFVKMRKYISANLIEQDNMKNMLIKHDNEIKLLQESFLKLEEKEKINHIFYEGQIYDAYSLLVIVITKKFNLLKDIDIKKYNKQYQNLKVIYSDKFHDRFIIIDKKVLYHSGASYKDLGNKCFAINKIKDDEYLENILIKIGL